MFHKTSSCTIRERPSRFLTVQIVMSFLVTKVDDRWNSGKCKLETAKSKPSTSVWTLLLLIRRRLSCLCLFVNTQDWVVFYVIEKSQASSPKKYSIKVKCSLHVSGIICSSRTVCVDFHAMNFYRRKASRKLPFFEIHI